MTTDRIPQDKLDEIKRFIYMPPKAPQQILDLYAALERAYARIDELEQK